jgi:hypothetical protein
MTAGLLSFPSKDFGQLRLPLQWEKIGITVSQSSLFPNWIEA